MGGKNSGINRGTRAGGSMPPVDRNSNKSKIGGDFFPVGRLIRVPVRFLENVAIVERALSSINQQSRTSMSSRLYIYQGIDVSLNGRIMEIRSDRNDKKRIPAPFSRYPIFLVPCIFIRRARKYLGSIPARSILEI